MVKVIKAKRIHLEKIADLWEEFMDHHTRVEPAFRRSKSARKYLIANLSKSFGDPNWQLLVAKYENEIVGFANIKIQKFPPVMKKMRYGYIQDMAVNSKYRRLGIGRALYDAAIDWYRQKKIKRVELLVMVGNKSAESFWKRAGFKDFMKRMKIEI